MAAAINAPTPEIGTTNQTDDEHDNKFIFCKIVKGEMGTELLHDGSLLSDETVSCFRYIHPGAPHHYLVVPRKHSFVQILFLWFLVEKLVKIGKEILQKNNVTDLNGVRFGFHWPSFCSVTHPHLHVLAPVSQMDFMSRVVYRLNLHWFITLLQKRNSMS
uniref:Histidine triad nucleotide binding protein 3 n=1 Tax=Sinocyclocheilus rhinocerous TaxID=307959 RepID=A0A673J4K5_9TELE